MDPAGHPYFVNGFLSIADYKGDGRYVLKEPCYPWDVEILKWMRIPPLPEQSVWNRLRYWMADWWMPCGPGTINEDYLPALDVSPPPEKVKGVPLPLV